MPCGWRICSKASVHATQIKRDSLTDSASTPLEILYQDGDCIAVNKPAGLLVHPSRIDSGNFETLFGTLQAQLGRKVFFLHRLDRPTSGVLLLALNRDSARTLCDDFREHRIRKQYVAVARGYCPDQGRIDIPLQRRLDRIADRKAKRDLPPQPAVTEYETVERFECPFENEHFPTSRFSLVTLRPLTGRTHQLRRHLKHISHPILGDRTHGDPRQNRGFATEFKVDRMMLVAERLCFTQPVTGRPIEVVADWGGDFQQAVDGLRAHVVAHDVNPT